MTTVSTNGGNRRFRFSLRHMLALTAIIAVWIAALLAFQKYVGLTLRHSQLLALSSRLDVADVDRLQSVMYPRVAKDIQTWEVHVPEGKPYELRFGVATVSQAGMPESYEKIPIAPGRHRITFRTADSVNENYQFTLFIDGQTVFDQSMGREWMPDGWRQASGLSPPDDLEQQSPASLHLAGEAYTPRTDYGSGTYFNGQSDDWVSQPGYRLWIDQADRDYPPVSPFIGFANDPGYRGIGLRDGLRYRTTQRNQYEWTIYRPAAQTNDPVLKIVPEFLVGDETALSAQTQEFTRWRSLGEPQGTKEVAWQRDPAKSAHSVFLHAEVDSSDAIKPVVELRWDASRPDDVGIRLAATPANQNLTNWRLRIVDGTSHLWRLLAVGDRQLDAGTRFGDTAGPSFSDPQPIELAPPSDESYRIRWKTDIAQPLQTLARGRQNNANAFRGMRLFRGLPLAFEAELAAALQPSVKIVPAQRHPDTPGVLFPGGPVIDELHIELDGTTRDWIWLRAVPR